MENIGEFETYRKVLQHRKNCELWGKGFCLDCFGGGLTQFTMDLDKERARKKYVRYSND